MENLEIKEELELITNTLSYINDNLDKIKELLKWKIKNTKKNIK